MTKEALHQSAPLTTLFAFWPFYAQYRIASVGAVFGSGEVNDWAERGDRSLETGFVVAETSCEQKEYKGTNTMFSDTNNQRCKTRPIHNSLTSNPEVEVNSNQESSRPSPTQQGWE